MKRPAGKPPLIAGVANGAIDIGINTGVIQRAGHNCHGRRTCLAAPEWPIEVSALTGRDATDNQPHEKNYRTDVHLDLP
jgi:hypothetical protein